MYDKPVWYFGDFEFPIHWLVLLLCGAATLILALLLRKKRGFSAGQVCLYGAIAAALGFLVGRGVYAVICFQDIFMDEMGEFAGVWRFFDSTVGSVNVMGFVAGILLAAPIAAALTKKPAAEYLDMAVVPALVMYILARMAEPLSGQGEGEIMEMEVCVSFIEAALTAIVLAFVPFLQGKSRKAGTLFQHALTLWCLAQILPESLRLDDSLSVFVFARVTHLGLAVTLGVTLLRLLIAGRNHLSAREITMDVIGLTAGLGLAIATIFALDKSNLPKLLVYAVMVLSFVLLGYVICRRIQKEDIAA
ncbi:MAG: hypothetical protein IKL25_04580 [Clostridia bacterium]|nr:hypothetical protein [Clostridia bacterium]